MPDGVVEELVMREAIFIITCLAGFRRKKLRQAISRFKEKDMDDLRLPIGQPDLSSLPKPWNAFFTYAFSTHQWRFLVPVFRHNDQKTLHMDDILPFIWMSEVEKSGAFGTVREVTVHERHQLQSLTTRANVAIKGIRQTEESAVVALREEWEAEVHAHREISQLHHPNIIEFIAAFTRGTEHYLMFRWADGGTLRDLWKNNSQFKLSADLVRDVVLQLRGLADALVELHEYRGGAWRHGDLKPENILRVLTKANSKSSLDVGILKISDMGLAKHHTAMTAVRHATTQKKTTFRYEPPEVSIRPLGSRSRRYDIWSFGCFTLEFLVWLLFGNEGLTAFNKSIVGDLGEQTPYYTVKINDQGYKSAQVHPEVIETMDAIAKDQEGKSDTAIQELLHIVRDMLLIVDLDPAAEEITSEIEVPGIIVTPADPTAPPTIAMGDLGFQGPRATAKELRNALDNIISEGNKNERYWFTGKSRDHIRRLKPEKESLAIPTQNVTPMPATLCKICQGLDFTSMQFKLVDKWADLEEQGKKEGHKACGFCKMRWNLLNDERIQVGLPSLPAVGSEMHFHIMRKWLQHCDDNHKLCQTPQNTILPKRLLDLGPESSSNILLSETKGLSPSLPYIALSHRWGEGKHFCTLTSNVASYQRGIPFEDLPATFRHAVVVARQLGIRYLWIDSICIVQGPGGDFSTEATSMETVFNSAICVLAASSSQGQWEGFLNRRPIDSITRTTVAFTGEDGKPAVYVSPFFDDFDGHVLHGPLSQRGWVLQERALARRTIYFTETQTYWECGEGVRCETLTKMDNQLASFLGDPNFPSKLSKDTTTRGEKILNYQKLFRQYSQRGLTRPSDRPIAIAGLEKRILQNLRCPGGYGVFDDGKSHLQHTLLWRRDAEVQSLVRIDELKHSIPSWSWMAYSGAIDYLDGPAGLMKWITDDIRSPWNISNGETWHTSDGREKSFLTAKVRDFTTVIDGTTDSVVVYDIPGTVQMNAGPVKCVLLGRENSSMKSLGETRHYVMIVARKDVSSSAEKQDLVYKRVGVGSMPGKYIDLETPTSLATIR
ncbi:hypothetical protein GQ53DRAFT_680702 [Thozetella sp. PMI_491]|nr:hypothetical protein GQ53DRAFT_680702 [Thozetella sp. PMI_491]